MDPSRRYFPTRKKKKSRKKDSSTVVFQLILWNFKEHIFLRTLTMTVSEDEHGETKLLHMISRLNKCYLWMICYQFFLATCRNGYIETFLCSRAERELNGRFHVCISFKKDDFFLEVSSIAPNVPPQLRHWYFVELYSPVTSSLHSSYKFIYKRWIDQWFMKW